MTISGIIEGKDDKEITELMQFIASVPRGEDSTPEQIIALVLAERRVQELDDKRAEERYKESQRHREQDSRLARAEVRKRIADDNNRIFATRDSRSGRANGSGLDFVGRSPLW